MLPLVIAKYRARLCGAPTWEQNQKSGNWQVAIPFTITAGEYASEVITWIGIMHGTVDKNGVSGEERVIQSLQYMGWQGDDISELAELSDEQAMQMMPEEVELSCAPDTYDGKTRLKVQWVNKVGAGRFAFKEPATRSDLKSFAAQMKGAIRNARGANGAKRPSAPHPNAPGGGVDESQFGRGPDDDIPFATADMRAEPSPIAAVIRGGV